MEAGYFCCALCLLNLPGLCTSWHEGGLSYWPGLQLELLIQVVFDLMRQLSIGQLMHAACHANSREALTPSCRALSRQCLLKACCLLHRTFCRSFLLNTELYAQTQAPSSQRAGELQRRHRQTVVQQDAQTHRAKSICQAPGNGWLNLQIFVKRADLTIHLRLALQFAVRSF